MTQQPLAPDGTNPELAPPDESDPPVDLPRVAAAVRRSGRLVAAIVVLITGLVVAVSLLSPERYRATARIAADPAPGEVADIETADRQLATSRELVTAPPLLADAARRLPGETVASLEESVSASLDPAVSILDVDATGEDPDRVAPVANMVAETFLAERERAEERVATRARERLADEFERLREAGAPATTLDAVRERLSELAVSEVTADSGLRLVQRAATPSAPFAPRPLRSGVLAFFTALMLALLAAIARDRIRPAVADAATLSRISGLPVIAALPAARRSAPRDLLGRLRRRPRAASRVLDQTVIEEAALQGAVRGALPPRGQRVVLVHGIDAHDGAGQVAAGLTRSLAWGGHPTVLGRFEGRDGGPQPPADVPTLRCTDIVEQLEDLRGDEYRYVVIQSPRAAAAARLRPLAARPTAGVLVAPLGLATAGDPPAARRLIDALGLRGLGLVVICAPEQVPGIVRTSLTAPVRPPLRPRAASQNGAHGAAEVPTTAPEGAPGAR